MPLVRAIDDDGARIHGCQTGPKSRQDDLANRRALARLLLLVGFLILPLSIFLWLATPGFFGPPPWYETAAPLLGMAGVLIGNVLMWWIYRSQPEPGERTWRYRDW